MMSGAGGELNLGTGGGGEEPPVQGTDQGSPGTGGDGGDGGGGGQEEQWVDLDPNQFAEPVRAEVEKINKAARSQFHKTVSRLGTENNTSKQKAEKLEGLIKALANDPKEFETWHKSQFPDHEYWKQRQAPQISPDDKQALDLLRKAGLVTKEDVAKILHPLIQKIHTTEANQIQRGEREANAEIDAHAKYCAEKKLPWNDEIGFACVELIKRGKADNLSKAYEMLYKPMMEKTAQVDLASKKLGSQTTQHSKTGEAVAGNQSLRELITNVVRGGGKG